MFLSFYFVVWCVCFWWQYCEERVCPCLYATVHEIKAYDNFVGILGVFILLYLFIYLSSLVVCLLPSLLCKRGLKKGTKSPFCICFMRFLITGRLYSLRLYLWEKHGHTHTHKKETTKETKKEVAGVGLKVSVL